MSRRPLPEQFRAYSEQPRIGGRPAFAPQEWHRKAVQKFAPLLKVDEIAALMGFSVVTLYKYFKNDLEYGKAVAHSVVAEIAFNTIVRGSQEGATAQQIAYAHDMTKFWLARRMGWTEPKNLIPIPEQEDQLQAQTMEALQRELREVMERKRIAAQTSSDMDPEVDEGLAEAAD